MKENKRTYRTEIKTYFNSISDQFEEVLQKYVRYDYDSDVEYVDFIIFDGVFYEEYSIGAMMMYNGGTEGSAMIDEFSSIKPKIDERLDFYDNDYDHRVDIFMKEVAILFIETWRRISREDNNTMKFYIKEDNGAVKWSLNTGKKSNINIEF